MLLQRKSVTFVAPSGEKYLIFMLLKVRRSKWTVISPAKNSLKRATTKETALAPFNLAHPVQSKKLITKCLDSLWMIPTCIVPCLCWDICSTFTTQTTHIFGRSLKTFHFSDYECIQHVRGFGDNVLHEKTSCTANRPRSASYNNFAGWIWWWNNCTHTTCDRQLDCRNVRDGYDLLDNALNVLRFMKWYL